ncbi:MAG: phycobilisome rod-core linker polypeptide [Bacteroidota bacterium]
MKKVSLILFVVLMLAGINVKAQNAIYKQADADELVKTIYLQVLEREAEVMGYRGWASYLVNGTKTVQDLVYEIGISYEYAGKFIDRETPAEAIRLMHVHFLGREPESSAASDRWVASLKSLGSRETIKKMVYSSEYSHNFGKTNVPYHR